MWFDYLAPQLNSWCCLSALLRYVWKKRTCVHKPAIHRFHSLCFSTRYSPHPLLCFLCVRRRVVWSVFSSVQSDCWLKGKKRRSWIWARALGLSGNVTWYHFCFVSDTLGTTGFHSCILKIRLDSLSTGFLTCSYGKQWQVAQYQFMVWNI